MYTALKRKDKIGKLTPRQALIQTGLDRGWGAIAGTNAKNFEDVTESQADYLHKSAVSYFLSGEPVVQSLVKQYAREFST